MRYRDRATRRARTGKSGATDVAVKPIDMVADLLVESVQEVIDAI